MARATDLKFSLGSACTPLLCSALVGATFLPCPDMLPLLNRPAEKLFRQRYKKAPSFLSIHMGIRADVLPPGSGEERLACLACSLQFGVGGLEQAAVC